MSRDSFYEDLLRPLLFAIDPEDAHDLVHNLLHMFGWALRSLPYRYTENDLQTKVGLKTFKNPVGLAAGFDKNARLVDVLGLLGFGFAEVGSITGRASDGNPHPRLFRLPEDHALINRMGLNGDGADAVASRLRASAPSLPLSINIAKTNDPSITGDAAVEDIVHSFTAIRGIDVAYVALNASCPNTKEGCLKEKNYLEDIFTELQKVNSDRVPIFVKVSPDSTNQLLQDIVELANKHKLAGFICGNTTTSREGLKTSADRLSQVGAGGMSGEPLRSLALDLCRRVARMKSKTQQIIGVGGINSGATAYEFIRAGASAVEVYTALIYSGPSLCRQICIELSALLKRDGLRMSEAIGLDIK